MHEYTAYVGTWHLVCVEACDYRAFVSRMTNRHGRWMCWSRCRWVESSFKHTASGSVEHVVEVTANFKETAGFGHTTVRPIFEHENRIV